MHGVGSQALLSWVPCSGFHKTEFEVLAGLCSHLEVQIGINLLTSSPRLFTEFFFFFFGSSIIYGSLLL